MAINECTVDEIAQHAAAASLTGLTTISTDTGVYVDVSEKRAGKLILLIKRDNATKAITLKVKASTQRNLYSDGTLGDLSVTVATGDTATRQQLLVIGPVETARFKDSADRVKITCTGSTGALAVGVLLIA